MNIAKSDVRRTTKLTLYVTAIAAEQDNWRASGQSFGRVKAALSAVSPEQFPLLASIKKDNWLVRA